MRRVVLKYLVADLLLSSLFCFIVMPALSQSSISEKQVKATVDSSKIKIGDQFRLTLQATANPSQELVWPQIPDSFDHFLVVDRTKIDTLKQTGNNLYKQQITLTNFDSGFWKIPAFSFAMVSGDSAITSPSLTTDSMFITVNTVAVDTTKPFKPIKQIIGVPFNILAYWPFILGGLIILAILIWLIFFRKKKTVEKPQVNIPQEPPYEQAIKNLHSLEEEKLWQHNEVKLYYTKLTDILRLYIQRRFGVNAMEQTSDELLQKIKPVTKLNQQKNNLQYILQTADLAKFAKLQPQQEEHENSMRKAYEIVEWTKPKEEQSNGEEGAKNEEQGTLTLRS
ncbi:MAG: hypothetical protein ACRDE2_08180 [Chitinophagaceae bacterium]